MWGPSLAERSWASGAPFRPKARQSWTDKLSFVGISHHGVPTANDLIHPQGQKRVEGTAHQQKMGEAMQVGARHSNIAPPPPETLSRGEQWGSTIILVACAHMRAWACL